MSELPGTVDVDFWAVKPTIQHLAPYLSASRREWLQVDAAGAHAPLPESQYFVPGDELTRATTADDPHAVVAERLDEHGIGRAVLNPGAASSVSGYNNSVLGAEFARAVNEWTADQWLGRDERLLGSIVVSPRDARRAAEEIRRAGADRRMAQVLISYPQQALGHRSLYPIYEAACELGIPVTLESGGAYCGPNGGLTAIGYPASVFEALVTWEFGAQSHLLSIVTAGVCNRYPELRLVLSGYGAAWLPSLLWRLDLEYRLKRVPTPASLDRLPSEIVRDHVRLTTSVLEVPEDPGQLGSLLSSVGGERLLVYGSGPLGGAEGRAFLDAAGPEWSESVLRDNAVAHYRLDVAARA